MGFYSGDKPIVYYCAFSGLIHINRIPEKKRLQVSEITMDMAGNMELIAKRSFPSAVRVTDRFHVQKLATEALQEMRIKHRWEAMDAENEAIYFDNRSTNASAESFNAKIKAFRRQFRGVRSVEFFLFRLAKLYA